MISEPTEVPFPFFEKYYAEILYSANECDKKRLVKPRQEINPRMYTRKQKEKQEKKQNTDANIAERLLMQE